MQKNMAATEIVLYVETKTPNVVAYKNKLIILDNFQANTMGLDFNSVLAAE
jgi:hypothetical protein